jgi:hypothetical protein
MPGHQHSTLLQQRLSSLPPLAMFLLMLASMHTACKAAAAQPLLLLPALMLPHAWAATAAAPLMLIRCMQRGSAAHHDGSMLLHGAH